ncbi:MAG: dephospho-CoA kinase [Gemmatimonadota bacterium]|nr:dephospho-CoA kinase [Gemmatimonadota bacterium]
MLVVGLTGNVAAGKSAVAELWREAGVPVVSADELARAAVAPGTEALAGIAELFGPGVIREDGKLDRAAVRAIVFRDEEALRALEAIVHPEVRRLRDEWTVEQREAGAEVVVWEIPLLFETGIEGEADVVVVVDAPSDVRLRRIVETRGLGEDEAEAVMEAQMAAGEKRRRADVVVENAGGREELAARAAEVLGVLRGWGGRGVRVWWGRGPGATRPGGTPG